MSGKRHQYYDAQNGYLSETEISFTEEEKSQIIRDTLASKPEHQPPTGAVTFARKKTTPVSDRYRMNRNKYEEVTPSPAVASASHQKKNYAETWSSDEDEPRHNRTRRS